MSEVIGVRVPKKFKEELQSLNIDYAAEIRTCLERIIKRKKLEQLMLQIDRFRNELSKTSGVTSSSAEIIREDREHTH